ncbi:MAG TPA: hypothetical protein VG796_24080 [Verrucomicrobiales bacterium]|jgi:hypothetical protein|nr:hypothetical protein [Verrucomicrobiales bacterium]
MKPTSATTEAGICLPGEESWDLWKQSSTGWQISQSIPFDQGGPASFKAAGVFGYPVSAAFAVPVRAATSDEELLPDIVDFQLEKQGLKPETPVGKLMDYRTVEREDAGTLLLASVLSPEIADDLPREAPERFEVTPYLYYLPDNHLVVWKELGRLVFCVTRGDQPAYYHALNSPILNAATVQEIEQLLMPLYTQGIVTQIEGIVLWTDSVEPGAAEELSRTFGSRVRSEPRPKPTLPQETWNIEPVSVAMGKIRAARMRRVRNIILACLLGYLVIPGFFVARYFLAQNDLGDLKTRVNRMQRDYGTVTPTIKQAKIMDAAINFDKYPIEVMNQIVSPLYAPNSEVRITSLEINRTVRDEEEKSDITIKGETSSTNQSVATRYAANVKRNLKDYKWDNPKIEPPKDGKVPFQINGNFSNKEEDAQSKP